MSQLQLEKQACKIDSFNPRAERHGENKVPAGDLKITVSGHSSLMEQFVPGLRKILFRKPDLVGEQQSLIEGDDLTQVAHPNMKPIVLDEDWPGYRLELDGGLEFSQPLVLTEVTLSTFKLEAINGGAVKLSFSASSHPDEEQSGALCQLIQQERYIRLVPPAPAAQQQLPTGGDGDTLDAQDAAEAQAEAERLARLGADA